MNIIYNTSFSEESDKELEALRRAVANALDRKRRLGHYSVTWKDGKPLIAGEDAPRSDQAPQAGDRPRE
jgi:hypothetical protein